MSNNRGKSTAEVVLITKLTTKWPFMPKALFWMIFLQVCLGFNHRPSFLQVIEHGPNS
jgi:hypothetical protein